MRMAAGQLGARQRHHLGPVDQDAAEPRGRPQDRAEQQPAATAHVDQLAELAEVIGRDDVAGLLGGAAGHRRLEGRPRSGWRSRCSKT